MDRPQRIPAWFLALHILLVMAAFLLGSMLQGKSLGDEAAKEAEALELAYRFALERHVQPQDAGDLLEGAIEGLIESLDDPYSRYVPPEDAPDEDAGLTGRYEGIGVRWLPTQDPPLILFPLPNSPADRAGLRPGDRVVAVDGKAVAEVPMDGRTHVLHQWIRGPEDSAVVLGIERDGAPLEIEVTRDAVQSRSIHWAQLLPDTAGLGYLQLKEFQDRTTEELGDAIDALSAAAGQTGADGLRGLVIDLRGNGGGQLTEAVGVCRLLLKEGVIVTTRGRDGEESSRYEAEPAECRYPDLPLVVLVDANSASASEVVAGCLKDNGRARLVGQRTFGKGLVQTVFKWQDRDFRLVLTTSHYYTPSGKCIERRMRPPDMPEGEHGVAPDVEVPVGDDQTRQIVGVLSGAGEPPLHHAAAYRVLCGELDRPCGPLTTDVDPQLAAAVQELRALVRDR